MNCRVCDKKAEGKKHICGECWNRPFNITSVCRADLQRFSSERQIAKLDDDAMAEIAGKMTNAYCDQVFWIDLEIIGENALEDA